MKIRITENQKNFLLEESEDYIQNIKRLMDSGDIDNIKLALQLGKPYKSIFNVGKALNETYQPLIDFVNLGNVKIKGETFFEHLEYILSLKMLYLPFKGIKVIPDNIGLLSSLESLSLNNNNIKELPFSIGKLNNLKLLQLSKNKLINLPISISRLINLKKMTLEHNNISIEESNNIQMLLPNCNILF